MNIANVSFDESLGKVTLFLSDGSVEHVHLDHCIDHNVFLLEDTVNLWLRIKGDGDDFTDLEIEVDPSTLNFKSIQNYLESNILKNISEDKVA